MKRIKIDQNTKDLLLAKFTQFLNTSKFSENRVNFPVDLNTLGLPENTKRPTVYIDAEAYLKILLYVRNTSTEIAWHGTVERSLEDNIYYIKNVFLYPQKIAAATVQTDQDKYQNWLTDLDDDTYNKLRFQGHSHVNFGVTPSGTDLSYYDSMLQVLPNSDYYTFMIINKSGNMTFLIYDLAANMIYETQDIDFKIISNGSNDLIKDIENEKEINCEKPYSLTTHHISGAKQFNYDDYDEFGYYGGSTYPEKKSEDINDIIDDINVKFKNPKLSAGKNKKVKVKGVKV